MMKTGEIENEFLEFVKTISHYEEAVSLLEWDLRTGAPKKGTEQRAEVLGTLSSEIFNLSVSEQMRSFIDRLSAEEVWNDLSEKAQSTVKECKKTLEKFAKIPPEEYKAFVVLTSQAESAWEEAKETADFQAFQPYLEKIVAYNRKYADWIGYQANRYDALLDDFEPGLTVAKVDRVFNRLKEQLVPLVQEINAASSNPETGFLFHHFPAENQRIFSEKVLQAMQYDFDAGRLDTTVHPFAIGLNVNDVRVTTKYDEKDFRTAVFGTIHEGGHALYEQNVSESFAGTPLATGTSMAVHESQSLFWENFVGRSRYFWESFYPELKAQADGQFDDVSLDDFYRGVNTAGPSLIRIEADELTYSLHIIVRYELEKALINEEIEVADLPEAWNNKMEELLGVRPSHDGEGVLQDVHWAGGMFGYFPSYALGYVYAAQLKEAMAKELPHFDELLAKGQLAPVKDWLTKTIHQHGKSKDPAELMTAAAGETMNPEPLLNYLTDKYRSVYNLQP
ncbi:carboxypeptidase M32 [Salisediminibacterium halotolerans]|uniref:carboxypeptidase M32 n=1 Tax=Salisediminibacterium halotolerans TaxID=517425 RepID=UPI000EB5CEA5|nr:carboxypeptidase M32 [Salisediminibacterium halotolerans]RLJ74074.1 carboxypeptidase Taq [Actinophytocola xinjiangensis]RPE87833.1 carboxypeptidase Taq [Salisediminibacterium halotolerans]TWG34911.1 carboxypeptidase Taq [Salisediminibacterium halotolerans]GEL07902.1 carboxypeptidase M32 [Salisediminibacterium halotolerans]